MRKKLIILIVCLVLTAALLAGCNESYKQDAIETDFSNLTVTSNGGLAVRAGKYLYYINGYAGNTVDNSFGKVQKGAIARVELDEAGIPKDDTNKIIVPKNVYNTAASSGLYIVGEYIYYSTPSIEKNSEGEPKTSEMHLMRTKLDGTDTKIIKKFKDYSPVYKVVDGYLLYVNSDKELHSINLNTKKFDDDKIDENISSYYMTPYEKGINGFIDAIFYIKASDNKNETHSVMWCYRAGGEKKKVIEGNKNSYGDTLEHQAGYTLSIAESEYVGENLRLIYTKTDNGFNKKSSGTYSYDFNSSLTFDRAAEVRYSYGSNYTNFYFLNNDNVVALSGSNVVLLKNDGERWTTSTLIEQSSAPVVVDIEATDTGVSVYYTASSVLYKIYVLDKEGENYTLAIKSAVEMLQAVYNTTWLSLDKVGNTVFFFNKNIKDNTYYLNLAAVINRNEVTKTPVLLGLVTPEDEIALLTE